MTTKYSFAINWSAINCSNELESSTSSVISYIWTHILIIKYLFWIYGKYKMRKIFKNLIKIVEKSFYIQYFTCTINSSKHFYYLHVTPKQIKLYFILTYGYFNFNFNFYVLNIFLKDKIIKLTKSISSTANM